MGGSIAPFPKHQLFDNNGDPAVGYQLFAYEAGTSTKLDTFTDQEMQSANTNPIVMDAAGRATIFLQPGQAYKFVFASPTDTDPPASPIWTVDNVNATEQTNLDVDVLGTLGEIIGMGKFVYLSDGSGSTSPGSWYLTDAGNTYSSIGASAIGFTLAGGSTNDVVAIRIIGRCEGIVTPVINPGSIYYLRSVAGQIIDSAPANARPVGIADGGDSIILSPWVRGTTVYPNNWSFASTSTLTVAGPATVSGLATFSTTPVGAAKIARCTSALTKNNNTTLADITGLAFSVAANEEWYFVFYVKGISTTTANWKFAVTGPAAPTAAWYGHDRPSNIGIAATATLGTAILREGITASPGTEEMIVVAGGIRNGANAGTIQLQMAQNTGEVFDTIIRADSHVIAWRQA